VQQRHTLDVLWLEVWRAVLWPNPFVHLLLPALRLTHELLADRAASDASHPASYSTLLARLAAQRLSGPVYSPLLQPFTFSFTLTRIAMLQNQNPVRHWKQWLVLPALGGLFFLGSHAALAQGGPVPSEAQQKAWQDDINRKTRLAEREDSMRTGGKVEPGTAKQVNITYGDKPGGAVVTVTRVPVRPAPPQPTTSTGDKIFTYVEQMPQLPGGGGQPAIVQAIQNKLVYPVGEKTEGRVFVKFTVAADGAVHDTEIVKGLTPTFDSAVLAAVKQLPQFEPGKQNGKPVAVTFTVPIQFQSKP
jgi:TonB family protein